MNDDKLAVVFIGVLALVASLGYLTWLVVSGSVRRLSPMGILISLAPSVLTILLLVTLAPHMHRALGEWPPIGDAGFPPLLKLHAGVTFNLFQVLMLATIFLWPIFALVAAFVVSWRSALPYLALYLVGFASIFGVLWLLPEGFQYWWWD